MAGGIVFARENLEFQMVGDPTISMSMVGESSQAMGRTEDLSLGKPSAEESKPVAVKPKKEKAVEEKPEPVEKPVEVEKEVIEVPREIVEEPLPEEVREEAAQEELLDTEDTDTPREETTEDTEAKDEKERESAPQTENEPQEMGEGFVQLEDGAWAAKNQGIKGLSYGFLAQPEPEYPEIARKMGINQDVTIKVRFLIGYKGRAEDIRFYDDAINYGFREEVIKALKNWKATPIEVDGKKVKLYFYKSFKFQKLN